MRCIFQPITAIYRLPPLASPNPKRWHLGLKSSSGPELKRNMLASFSLSTYDGLTQRRIGQSGDGTRAPIWVREALTAIKREGRGGRSKPSRLSIGLFRRLARGGSL